MICIDNGHTDAYFNIAAEEYLLKRSQEDIFMLYRNEPSVIIGKHQDARAEIDMEYTAEHNIKIVRRFSGGGAVFHDLGNLNLTFIGADSSPDFEKYTKMMVDMLSAMGIRTTPGEHRSLTVDGFKISGSAQAVHKNRVMYHSTLLFSSDLAALAASLNGCSSTASGKRVKMYVHSVKSRVANIAGYMPVPVDTDVFGRSILKYFLTRDTGNTLHRFTSREIAEIEDLKNSKYATREWNFDACVPDYKKQTAWQAG